MSLTWTHLAPPLSHRRQGPHPSFIDWLQVGPKEVGAGVWNKSVWNIEMWCAGRWFYYTSVWQQRIVPDDFFGWRNEIRTASGGMNKSGPLTDDRRGASLSAGDRLPHEKFFCVCPIFVRKSMEFDWFEFDLKRWIERCLQRFEMVRRMLFHLLGWMGCPQLVAGARSPSVSLSPHWARHWPPWADVFVCAGETKSNLLLQIKDIDISGGPAFLKNCSNSTINQVVLHAKDVW